MTTNTVASRAMDDFIAQERRARQKVEADLAACLELLTELAVRLGGEAFENLRRDNPGIPKSWGPEEWKDYLLPAVNHVLFRSIRWDGASQPQPGRNDAQEEIARLRKQLEEAQARLAIAERAAQEAQAASKSAAAPAPRQSVPEVRFKSKEPHQAIKVTPQTAAAVQPAERPIAP